MKVAIIGPTHPYKGGIAQHTTELAHRLYDRVESLLCDPDDAPCWPPPFTTFYEPGVAKRLSQYLPATHADRDWDVYNRALTKP